MTFIKYLKRLNCIDLLILGYLAITMLFIMVFFNEIPSAGWHLLLRIVFSAIIVFLPFLDRFNGRAVFKFLRIAYPLFILAVFYSETDALNNVFLQNLDRYFARLDSILFGFQPSLAFYERFPQKWFSELMNMGYFSYYILIAVYAILIFLKRAEAFERTVFYISGSFLIYYLVFILLPVAGPQYFFEPPHNQIADSGIFRKLVLLAEHIGERPTAAFPSSHVGIVLILIFMAWSDFKPFLWWLVPAFLLLAISTVYVKAHYAVDVLGGFASAPIVLALSKILYRKIKGKGTILNTETLYAKG